jgi:DNA (cytosine-5)-methyltransferase 1
VSASILDTKPTAGQALQPDAPLIAATLTSRGTRLDYETEAFIAHTLRGEGFDASEDGTGRGIPIMPVDIYQCQGSNVGEIGALRRGNGHVTGGVPFLAFNCLQDVCPTDYAPTMQSDESGSSAIAFDTTQITSAENRSQPADGKPCHALARDAHPPALAHSSSSGSMAVRRLTPRECERLQGFPDNYTAIPYGKRGRVAKDGPRYKALGNSMAVPVMRWIGERLLMVEAMR